MEVTRGAWDLIRTYMKHVPDGSLHLLNARLMPTLLATVAAHSGPGVASSALLTLATVLGLGFFANLFCFCTYLFVL